MAPVPPPVDLRVEHEHDPIGLDEPLPRLSWRLPAGTPEQSGYQVQVQGIDVSSIMWDTGRAASADSIQVTYGGPELRAFASYRWRVRYWAGADDASDWATGTWSMGPMGESDWAPAHWVTAGDATPEELRPAPLLRRVFEREGSQVASATLFVCGLGYATCHVNGQPVTADILQPAPTNYDKTALYNSYDVTSLVQQGRNCLAVELGRGRFADLTWSVWNWHRAHWVAQPRLRAFIRIANTSGEVETVGTDDRWLWHAGPTRADSLFRGETYDARQAVDDWTNPAFDDSDWIAVHATDGPAGRLRSQRVEPIRVTETVTPVAVRQIGPGTTVFDFGRQIAGRSVVDGSGLADGESTRIIHAETCGPDGHAVIDQQHGRPLIEPPIQTDEIIASGGQIRHRAQFTYKGFRFVEVDCDSPAADWKISAEVLHTDVATTGAFECSDDGLNMLHQASVSSILSNLHGLPTDTPVYEKNGWTADGHLSMEAAIANFDMARLYTKWLDDFADSQRADGEIPPIVPTSGDPGWGYSDSGAGIVAPQPSWDAAYPEVAWAMWQYYGDRRIVERHFEGLVRYLKHIVGHLDGFIFHGGLGDWWTPNHSARPREDADLHQTAYVARWMDLTARMAGVLNEADTLAWCEGLHEQVTGAFQRTFFDDARGFYAAESGGPFRQAANAVPLALGLVPQDLVGSTVDAIVQDVLQRNDHPDTGVIGIKHLLQVLSGHGHHDLAVRVATVPGYPGLLRWFDDGVLSLHEGWDDDARSHNHHYFASVDQWLFERVLGVKPAAPGYRTVRIELQAPQQVQWARGHVTTPSGRVDVTWHQRASGFELKVRVPPGVEAAVPGVAGSRSTQPVVFGPGEHDLVVHPKERRD